ncbi:ERCC4 domain-containing protein [Hypoxylon rubiginosum]|uniref:ERCC4 domain-containing protein n=1 Tax=Hypoxylon rubiginosum TaxID=110542 RepID=A0ACC0CSM8_9PEZI|nr:ERCC4 domain-containing protein [Hypoxylon rubiginosum]
MPPEVINLLSSSPAAPTPPLVTSTRVSSRTQAIPSRVLDYGALDLTAESSNKAARKQSDRDHNEPGASKKRGTGHSRHDNDYLFLSDDFDTTGDLEGNTTKKARFSTSSKKDKEKTNSTFTRTKSAVAASETLPRRSSAALKRWSSVADPIEHSSSPGGFTTNKHANKPHANSPDPLESPPRKRTSVSQLLGLSSDPFGSSPVRDSHSHQPPAQSLLKDPPLEPSTNSKSSKVPVVIDLSDDEPEHAASNGLSKKPKPKAAAWDPISSSMPEARTTNDLGGSGSDSDLPDLDDINFAKINSTRRAYSLSSSPPPRHSKAAKGSKSSKSKKPAPAPKKTEEEKEREKRKKAEEREAEKERKQIEKERAKEQRAIDKQKEKALAEVNKLKTNKTVAAPEMIVDLPMTLNAGIKAQIEKLLSDLSVRFEYQESPVDNVVRWRRWVDSTWDEKEGMYQPVPKHIKKEDHVLVIIEAADFVKLVLGDEGHDLEAYILTLKTCFPDTILVFLMEGLMPWMRKNKNILNRRFASAVRAMDADNNSAPASSQARRRKAAQQEYIDEDIIEDALLSLQVVHRALIHHTNAQVETAEWVSVFTQNLSTAPYRKRKEAMADANFCMDVGQVKTGEDAKDTYVRMLQEVNRVTAPIAHGIAAKYGTVGELVRGLEKEGPGALENCRKSSNRDGAFTDRVVGPAISRRMYKIFTSRDPLSMDV